ncbi:MAG: hypothetical protein LQ351_002010 [Letrouitia transgressa]|nr:MAG: hypothetical protein LQ351_002010 [Letrouitia transgressa]
MSHAMSDDQVAGELKKMTAFIRQEALEKAKEIQIKADEEFAIEKSKLVRQETAAIDSQYEKKFKQASMSQQITRSTLSNKTRIKVLSARQELLDDLFEKARGRLADFAKDKGKYQEMSKNLILEGLYALNEEKVAVRARKGDYDVVKKAIEDAKAEYKQQLKGREVQVDIDEKNPQPEGSSGGLSIIGGGGKIDINNTFEERLKLLETDALPSIRKTLFGTNKNRHFAD